MSGARAVVAGRERRPRVVYLADALADVRMVEGFSQCFELTLLAPEASGEAMLTFPAAGEFCVVRPPGGRLRFNMSAAAWLIRNRCQYDTIIVLDNLWAALAANAAGLVARRPVVIQQGRSTIEYFESWRAWGRTGPRFFLGLTLVRLLVGINERTAAGVAAVSQHVGKQSARRNPRTRVIAAYGVDTAVFSPGARAEARRALALPTDVSIALFRSRLAREKDPETFLRAVAELRGEGRDVVALYVGGEHREFASIAAAAAVPCISRGPVHPMRDLPLYYRAADVAVQTSHAEGLGISPLEALACGTPVVVSAVGGLPEVLPLEDRALAVPPRDPQATAAALRSLLDDPEGAEAAATRGRRHVVDRYSAPEAFSQWDRYVRWMIGGAPEGTGGDRPDGALPPAASRSVPRGSPGRWAALPPAPPPGGGLAGAIRQARFVVRFIFSHPGNAGRRWRVLAWAVSFHLTARLGFPVPTTAPLGNRSRVLLRLHSYSSTKALYANPPDWPEMLVWQRHLRAGDRFVDVGAHIGLYTLLAAELGAEVVAIEPAADAVRSLQDNLALNGYHVDVRQGAASDAAGPLRLTVGLGQGNHIDASGASDEVAVVEAITLDDVIGDGVVRGVKVDVEGAELLVLRGAVRALTDRRIDLLQLEWNDCSRTLLGQPRSMVEDFLAGLGYELCRAGDDGTLRPVVRPDEGNDVFARPAPSGASCL